MESIYMPDKTFVCVNLPIPIQNKIYSIYVYLLYYVYITIIIFQFVILLLIIYNT